MLKAIYQLLLSVKGLPCVWDLFTQETFIGHLLNLLGSGHTMKASSQSR